MMTKVSALLCLMAAGLMVTATCVLAATDQDKATSTKTPPAKTVQPTFTHNHSQRCRSEWRRQLHLDRQEGRKVALPQDAIRSVED